MSSHELRRVIEDADRAITCEDLDALMEFYADDATLVVQPGMHATGKQKIRDAFVAISEYFEHSLAVRQGEMVVIEGSGTALVLARTLLNGTKAGEVFNIERLATYVFQQDSHGRWLCTIDNSYGTDLLVQSPATLYLVCGKIGAGKSTAARTLAKKAKTVLIAEDDWLSKMYPDEIRTLADYVRCTGRFRMAVAGHIEALLAAGMSVVLDFPANTSSSRQWARSLIDKTGAAHELHFLDVPDEICKARLKERNAAGSHPFQASEEDFERITGYFVPPAPDEGFHIIISH
jgi:uncharacterized protein (TIGR02246 family)